MTDEIPKRDPTDPEYCSDCHKDLLVERDDRGSLHLTCGCDTKRSVKVKRALPEAWSG